MEKLQKISECMKNDIFVLTLVVFFAMVVIAAIIVAPSFGKSSIDYVESPLSKNSKLQIQDGDVFEYKYYLNNTVVNITYVAIDRGCTMIFISESVNKSSICIEEYGMDESGSNSSFSDPAFILFKPWMLAVKENWSWKNSMYMNYDGVMRHIADNEYKVVGIDEINGKKNFKIEINSSDGTYEYNWVDVDKRIINKIQGKGFVVELVNYSQWN